MHIMAEAQKEGGIAAFIRAVNMPQIRNYAQRWRLGPGQLLLISQPDTAEQAFGRSPEALVRSGAVDVVVVDSVTALVPGRKSKAEMGATHVGLQARLMSQALRKLTGAINTSRTTVVFINQIRRR